MTSSVAIFGLSGFIGAALAASLSEAGWDVQRPVATSGERVDIAGPVDEVVASIRGADVVVNAAGRAHLHSDDPGEFWPANAVGAFHVALAAKNAPSVRRLVHVSSAAVGRGGLAPMVADYEPVSAYGASKAAGELAVGAVFAECEETELVVVRPAGISGIESPGSWGTIRRRAAASSAIPVPNNEVRFDVIEIESVVRHLHSAVTGDLAPGIYSLAGDQPLTLREYAETVSGEYHTSPRIIPVPNSLLRLAREGAAMALRLTGPVERIGQLATTMTTQRPLMSASWHNADEPQVGQ